MRKLKLFFACLLMAVLSIGQMWAEETLLFSQTYPGSPSGYPNSYTGSYTLTTGDYTLTYANINNGTKATDNWTAVRAGRKNNASVASVTTGQIATAVSKVTITFTQVNADLTNDLYLEVADNANFTSATKISQSIALSEVAFTIASPAANQYYRIMIDQKSGSNNGFTRFSGVAFYYNEGGGDDPVTPTPSLSVSPTEIDFGSVELGASVPSEALTVTFANLTGDVTYSTLGGPFSASGTIEASGDQITISAEAAEAGQYSETFTVQSNEDNLSKTVTVKMNVFEPFNGLELTFPAYNDESIGSYSSTWTATKSEQVWTIANFNNNKNGWNLIKAGSKNNTSVASITTYVENPVESIVVTVSSVTADLVNSHKLYVADNSSFDNAIEIDGNPATIAAGDITYVIPEADRANNLYYKLEYDLKQGSANGFLQITKLTYAYGTAAPQKPAAGLAYAEADKKQLVKFGETFTAPTLNNPNNLTNITYASNNTEVAEVDVNGAVTIKAIGVAVIAVSFAGDDNYKAGSDTYTICVVNHLGTEADPFDVADARRVIDAFGTKEGVYMSGIVSQITTPYDETYHNISFDISTDGTPTADQVRAYRCKGLDNTDFTSEDDVKTGATVTVYGNLKKYNSTYEFDAGCYLKAYEAPAVPKTHIANTKETAYTVAQALVYAADGVTYDLEDYVYVSGVVYDVKNFSSTDGTLNIYIKDANAENQFELYKCAGVNNGSVTSPFTSVDDVQVGNVVIGYGQLMYFQQGNIYEFKQGNYLVDLQTPVTGVELDKTQTQVEEGLTVELTPTVLPSNVAPQTIVWSVVSGSDYASVDNGYVTGISEGEAVIRATVQGTAFYAECTVTVTASSSPDTRKVANSPAKFTETSGDLDPADIAFEAFKGGAGTAPAIYNKGIRLYQKGGSNTYGGYVTLTAVAGCTIDEVQITTTSTYSTTVAYSIDDNVTLEKEEEVAASGSYTTGTGLNTSSVNILNLGSGSSGRLEIASIKVYYTGEALTIDHYELGGTYATEFEVGDDFNHNGLIVYAAYDALGENKIDITSACTFSTPDMSAEGEQIIEISYKDAVVKSYTITVNASTDTRKVADSPATFTAVSGDLNPNEIKYAAKQGGAGNAPYLATGGIRLYQKSGNYDFGGFMTIKAAKGCTIDQVKITTSGTYATTVAYSVDGNENLLQTQAVAKSGSYTTPEGLNVESVNILNLGSGSDGRLEIASIKVWYTGEALPLDHYFLAGQYPTEFVVNTTFSYEGLEVYAAYDAQETIVEAVEGFTVVADLSNEGQTTASVRLNNAEIATYNITVVAQTKLDPALSYDPEEAVVAAEAIDAWTAPALSNTYNVAVSYSSSKEAVATVDAEGTISLAGGYGTAVITASFAGDDTYLPSEATYTITVNEPAEDLSGTWTRVTAVAVGQKIIIAGTYNDKTMTMGMQNSNNRAAVLSALEGDVLTPAEGTKVFTLVDAGEGLFAIQALNGKYLNAAGTGNSNYLREADDYEAASAKWTITFDENGANIVATSTDNRNVIRYNSTKNSELFSCYAAGGQRAIQIYSTTVAPEPPTPQYETVRGSLTPGNYYTLCFNKTMTEIQGASLWSFCGKSASMAYIVEAQKPYVAGTPYLIYAESDKLEALTEEVANPQAGSNNGLYGTFSYMDADALSTAGATYMLKNNELRPLGSNNHLDAYRAYVILNEIPGGEPAPAPGRRVRAIPMQQNGATGFENIEASEKPMKLMIDGKIYILRGEKMYDATGRLVK